ALLEAMGERQVTVDGITRALPRPFMVMATQNPVEYEGTFPLPEAQLDRFLLKVSLGYLSIEQEKELLLHLRRQHPIDTLEPVIDGTAVVDLSEAVWEVHVDDTLRDYIVRLVDATRQHPDLLLGASPRGSLALYRASQALAALRGRTFVLPDDIKLLAPLALAHRCIVQPESALRGRTAQAIVNDLLAQVALDIGQLS
ncbi:MAG: MoxR family ATPase, partial [Anaerolineae bacterium]|nr:MoxR family ATPase [Anaerolineae bacterium]